MTLESPRLRTIALATLLIAPAWVVACEDGTTSGPEEVTIRAGKGGGGKGGGGKGGGGGDPQVDSTEPDKAPQGATLDVRVFGSNFVPGSQAEFLLAGQSTGDIATNSTTVVNEGELIANITIDDLATTTFYDVQVKTPDNKGGIGAEMFEVLTAVVATGGIKTLDIGGAPREEEISAPFFNDSKFEFGVRFDENAATDLIEVAFVNSLAAAGAVPGNCSDGRCGACMYLPSDLDQTDPTILIDLAQELVKAGADRSPGGLRGHLDLKKLQAEGDVSTARHTIQTEYWHTTYDVRVEVGIRRLSPPLSALGSPTIELIEKDRDNGDGRTRSVYRVKSGAVRSWYQGSPNPVFACPLLDEVDLTVLRVEPAP